MSLSEIDADIIHAFKDGDPKAFDVLFTAHYHHLCYFAMRITDSRGESEDIAKDSFIKLWNGRAGFSSAAAVKSFLYTTTKNAAINFLHRERVKSNYQKEFAYLQDSRRDELILNQLIKSEFLEEIFAEIERLPEKRREVFRLAIFEGLSNQEIADLLKISVYTVKVHKGKAIAELRARFGGKQLVIFLMVSALITQVRSL
jgi:RNA polymerase sigma-70 factor (family 1)